MSGLLGMFGNKDKEEKAEQEKIGTAMKNLSDQIASLQQQGMGKDSEISRLKEELSELQGKAGNVGDAAKKQMQEMNSRLAVAEADKQANELMLKNAQKQISELQNQVQNMKDAAGQVVSGAAQMGATEAVMAVGASAWVRRAGGMNLRRRSGPSLNSNIHDGISPGTKLSLLEGPINSDGHTWWRIRTEDGREGWVAGEELVTQPD